LDGFGPNVPNLRALVAIAGFESNANADPVPSFPAVFDPQHMISSGSSSVSVPTTTSAQTASRPMAADVTFRAGTPSKAAVPAMTSTGVDEKEPATPSPSCPDWLSPQHRMELSPAAATMAHVLFPSATTRTAPLIPVT